MAATQNSDTIVKPTTEARQGVTGHNVRYVLILSTLAAFVALFAICFAYFK